MTRTWSVQDAKANFSELLREAQKETQIITRHGKVIGVVNGPDQHQKLSKPRTALEALRGNFDFSNMPDDDDWVERDQSPVDWPHPFEDEQ